VSQEDITFDELPAVENNKDKSVFETLSNVDIGALTKEKGTHKYLPWSVALRVILKRWPSAHWEFKEWDGLPFLETKFGFFVSCSFTIEGVTRTQLMPVLDNYNKPIKAATLGAHNINNSQMRALAKVISLHGLGLNLWAGEDYEPTPEEMAYSALRATITRTDLVQFINANNMTVQGVCDSLQVADFNTLPVKDTYDIVYGWAMASGTVKQFQPEKKSQSRLAPKQRPNN
jgi:hypothetical protein